MFDMTPYAPKCFDMFKSFLGIWKHYLSFSNLTPYDPILTQYYSLATVAMDPVLNTVK